LIGGEGKGLEKRKRLKRKKKKRGTEGHAREGGERKQEGERCIRGAKERENLEGGGEQVALRSDNERFDSRADRFARWLG
jgi:hypothetical protein